jgi:hypothetical protein
LFSEKYRVLVFRESEDTILMILKEIYSSMEISPDNQVPQQTMTIERHSPIRQIQNFNSMLEEIQPDNGVDPTVPISFNNKLGPPPMSGFVKRM